MRHKRIVLLASLLVLAVLSFNLLIPEAKATTLAELQVQINKIYTQIAELQRLLSQIQPTGSPEEQIQKTEKPGDFAPGRLLVRFKDNVPESRQADILQSHGLTKKGEIKQLKVKIISVPERAEEKLAQALSRNPNIEWAEPDYMVETLLIPNDPYYSVQWGLDMVQAPEAWDITTGSSDVIIAILDTGIDTTHPDLKDKVVASINFTGSNTSEDIQGHGTHVAGIAAASTNNAIGVAGLGYDSSLMNVKVLGDGGSGYWSWVASGITWAADNGAHVINMSLGGTSYSDLVEDAVNYAWDKGVVVIAGAGNRGTTTRFYPAAYDNCISVAATTQTDVRASWSTYGNWVDVAAPGASIFATLKDGGYGYKSGTSMASPHVAGLAGLLASTVTDVNDNGFINDEIRFIIENTTDNKGAYGIINGRINAFSAITFVPDDNLRILTGTITGTGAGTVNVSPPDINYTDNFTRDYEYGTAVNLTATPDYDGGSLFFGWSGGCTGREDCSLYMFLDKSVTATFNIGHTLNVSSIDGGSVLLPGEGEFVYRKDQTVTLRAIADLGYQFVNWTGDTGTIGNPDYNRTTVIMKDDYSITANFEPAPECVTYNGYTYCRGFRSTDPQGSSCEAACSERGYICTAGDNMLRSLSEITEVGFKLGLLSFGESTSSRVDDNTQIWKYLSSGSKWVSYDPNWNQICNYTPFTSSAIEKVQICRCEGEVPTYNLTVSSSPITGISISSATGHSGTTNYTKTNITSGTSISLTAPATYGSYAFSSWTGCDSASSTTCSLTQGSNRTVTANYVLPTHTLSVTKSGTGLGTITSNPAGISCGTTCSASYNQGTSVTLTATADTNSTFSGWSGACTGTGTCTLTMDSNKSVTATFNTSAPVSDCTIYNGYLYCRGFKSIDSQGSSCNTACSERGYTCPVGDNMFRSFSDIVSVATTLGILAPGESYNSLANGYPTPYIRKIISTGRKTIYYKSTWDQSCTYAPRTDSTYERVNICRCQTEGVSTYNLTVSSSPVTGISISSTTGHSGTTNYTRTDIASGTSISLTAPATYSSYAFSSWTGCDSVSSRTCNLTLNSNKAVTANYSLSTHTLSVSKTGTGSGTVGSSPAGISCGATCSASYNQGTSVTLTATADANSTFSGWSGACTGTGTCTVTMDSNKSVTATFNAITYTLSVNSSPVTGISISSATGHSGNTNYTKTNITSGTSISLTAPATYGSYTFSSWIGCDSASSTTCYLTANTNKTVTANYVLPTHTLSVTKSGTGSGTVTSNPAGIICGTTCSADYDHNTAVTLTATPNPDSTFTGWSGDCTGTGTCTITMDSDKSVTATFDTSAPVSDCTIYNGYFYCRGFRSTDPQGSSCNAACSERGYACPVGDNMFRSLLEIAEVAVKLDLLAPLERYNSIRSTGYYSPYVGKNLDTGAKAIHYSPDWNQNCTQAPRTSATYETIKICRCQEPSFAQIERQLASLSEAVSVLIEQLRSLIGR